MVEDLWDLRAVVEGFSRSRTTTVSFSTLPPALPGETEKKDVLLSFSDEAASRTAFQEVEEFVGCFSRQPAGEQNNLDQLRQRSTSSCFSSPKKSTKRRKKQQMKAVCELPADSLVDNVWAWRKYGQKPIKDSPYPRGYYRCSSCKGCPARKQIERSRTSPGMFIVTYTAEHNHAPPIPRGSLNRQKSTLSSTIPMLAEDGGSPATPMVSPAAGDVESPTTRASISAVQPIPPPEEEAGRDAEGSFLGDDLDKFCDDDFIFMDLDQLIDPDPQGGGFTGDLIDSAGFVWPPNVAGI